ncbi:dnaJ homolog subfamily C member 24-like [Halichondria panicea]|uniref:dnaJ homolog subfamily C member 24-like n=1 Tax=Halichondria panicea TaxID=6063 RepID=UPI00312B7F01
MLVVMATGSGGDDLYSVLEVAADASVSDVRRSYQRLVKECHPDKLSAHLTDEERDTAMDKFHTLSKAYQVLSDQESKALYDANSQSAQITQKWPLSDTVDLDTMTFDPASKVYSLSCRCGGCYLISESDMEDGVEVSCCTSCTLCVRVLYQLARDER